MTMNMDLILTKYNELEFCAWDWLDGWIAPSNDVDRIGFDNVAYFDFDLDDFHFDFDMNVFHFDFD